MKLISAKRLLPPENELIFLRVEPKQDQIDLMRGKYQDVLFTTGKWDGEWFYFYDLLENKFFCIGETFTVTHWYLPIYG